MFVELADELLEARAGDPLAVALEQLGLDGGDRMLAVEQREDLDQIDRQHDDLGDVAGRVPQRDVPLALLLDRERLDRPESRRVAHGFRKLRADAT